MKFNKEILKTVLTALLAIALLTTCNDGKKDPGIEETGWEVVNLQNYEYSMTYVTQIAFDNVISANVLTELGAFVGDVCRGKANLSFEPALNIYLCHLTIYSQVVSGEQITLKAYNPDTKKIYTNCGTLQFQSNASVGSAGGVLYCLP